MSPGGFLRTIADPSFVKQTEMDVKQLAQDTVHSFNDRSFREKAKEVADPKIVVIDKPTGREFHGGDGFIQFSESAVIRAAGTFC